LKVLDLGLGLGLETSLWLLNKQRNRYSRKYFRPLPLQLQWNEYLVTVGCSRGQTGYGLAIGCCHSWCFCVAI